MKDMDEKRNSHHGSRESPERFLRIDAKVLPEFLRVSLLPRIAPYPFGRRGKIKTGNLGYQLPQKLGICSFGVQSTGSPANRSSASGSG
jgi:hypothetical protein